jgi:hypothetical protein
MARFQLVGPDYTSQSPVADVQKTENLYVEAIESGQGKSQYALYPTPGLTIFCTLPATCRLNGSLTINGRMFQVAGGVLYEIFSAGNYTARGTVGTDGAAVSMAAAYPIQGQGTPQLAIVSAGSLYVLNLITNVLQGPIIGLDGVPFQIVYADGFYFLLLVNGQWQVSAGYDATTWMGDEVEATSSYPDKTVAIGSVHRQFYTFSSLKGTAYFDAGDQPIPYDEVSGGDFEQGCAAPWSVLPLDNTIFFLGANKEGTGIVWRLNGYIPIRISNHAIEFAMQGYSTITDAVAYGYQDQGHTFYVLYFPTANVTWVYDCATQMWHRRSFWNATTGTRTAHRSCSHAYCFGMHLVGDWASGNVYQMSISQTMDFGNVIKRVRRAPHIANENEWMFYQQLQIDVEMGLTPSQLLPGQAPPTFYTLRDTAGGLWNVGTNDLGVLGPYPTANQGWQTLFLTDPTGAFSYEIIIALAGNQPIIDTQPVTLDTSYPRILTIYSTTGKSQWNVTVNTLGILQTQFVATVYRNPQITLRYSKDEGHTWYTWGTMDCGSQGSYKARAIARRLGRARDMVFELEMTDPYPWRIVDAYLKALPGYEPTERLTDRIRKMA